MKKRITFLAVMGCLTLVAAFFGLRHLVWLNRPQTEAEWRSEKRDLVQAKWRSDFRKDILDGIASARNEKERRLYEYDLRLLDLGEVTDDITSLVKLNDGIDEFEALLIARAYFGWQFGSCGMVELPERNAERWIAAITAGREAKPEPPIVIDARTGTIRCDGHPTILDSVSFLKQWPNKAPEPTPGAVTPRATEGTSK